MLPELSWNEALTLVKLGRWSGEFPALRFPIRQQPANAIQGLDRDLAELTAQRIGWLPSIIRSRGFISRDLSAEAWTDRVITRIRSDAAKFAVDQTRIPAIVWFMLRSSAATLVAQRRAGKLGDVRQSVDRLLALATRLTQSHPDHAATYMVLSEAYLERAKLAYRVDDEPVIGWERKSLDAALHAATLEPDNDEARSLVNNRRARLDKLVSK
jgi:hypothetical protein